MEENWLTQQNPKIRPNTRRYSILYKDREIQTDLSKETLYDRPYRYAFH